AGIGEARDPCHPVEAVAVGVVLLRVEEGAVVRGVDGERAVVAPAVGREGLTARSREGRRLSLRQGVHRVAGQASGPENRREEGGARGRETDGAVALVVLRGRS